MIKDIELAWQVRPLPQLFPNYGNNGLPFWGYECTEYDCVMYHAFGFWWFSLH